ncbi:TPA: response regulator receiver domain [Escherichia coli]|uniref:Response receiver domain-containing protein n=1 Tax=Phocaeicola coprocola TaxID=310298 RepID=A0A921K3Q2_9BACT|nr:response regulator receiver domain [Escherichia coli]EFA4036094.1 hypothetical protein [Escherichia coli O120:H10]HJF08603.1 hypothetical protein [Phocaeicola coprocola]EFN4622309.1 hypothetical protein [Escherichia coli]EIF5179399.1 hypothetical protein [Escherichia coli]KXR14476.1 hypothetical protein AUQ12_04800 [Escherichia coli]
MTNIIESYSELIKEAFITPIRTVTVIDDEYPTLLSLITVSTGENAKKFDLDNANTNRLKKIISMCHSTYRWSIDVLDGQTPEFGRVAPVPSHIRHSDLIILDYHLDGEGPEDEGVRARNIIQSLAKSNHYNLALVHTKGSDGDIKTVFTEILKDLICISPKHELLPSKEISEKIEAWITDHEDEIDYKWLQEDVGLYYVLKIYLSPTPERCINPRAPEHPLQNFAKEIIEVAANAGVTPVDLMKWRFAEILKKNNIKFSEDVDSSLDCFWCEETNYISTGKMFISVIKKGTEDPKKELIGSLINALTKRNASPMHLLMAKMRFELDEKGIEQAAKIISNRYAQAGWLYNLLKNADDDSAHDKAINLHWEQLATASRLELRNFSKRIMAVAKKNYPGNEKQFVKTFFRECMNQQDLTLGHLNAFSCSMPISNSHLMTGTVLDIEGETWVCITPACDLVPGQKISQWESRIGQSYLVFKAVKLEATKLETANKNANRNDYIYLNTGETLSAYELGSDNPSWDTFYAADLGRYGKEFSLTLFCARECTSPGEETPLKMKKLTAYAIAELRYEYALNLLHKFGSSQTRVGLDFQSKNNMWT